jgi:cytochrome-b5 reductase
MIAGGSGIAPLFQLIQKIVTTRADKTGVALIYCVKSIEDIAFCEDLINYDLKGRLSFYPVVENVDNETWNFGRGKLNEEIIFNYMPSPQGNIIRIIF